LLGALSAFADEYPIAVKTGIGGEYIVVEKAGTASTPTLVVKRGLGDKENFTKRAFDSPARTVTILGRPETFEALAEDQPDARATPIEEGTFADQLAHHVCPMR
jgi:hypothetical protein